MYYRYYGYETVNNINNDLYIGVHTIKSKYTKNFPVIGDNKFPDGYMGSGKKLHLAFKKYGIENFRLKIIFETEESDIISYWEEKIVDEEFINRKNVYNLRVGGKYGGKLAAELIERIKQKLSTIDRSGENNSFYGKTHSDKTKKIISEKIKNLYLDSDSIYNSSEYKSKLLIANAGENNGFYGKQHSIETKEKISNSKKGRLPWNKGVKNKVSKSLLEISTNKLYQSIKQYYKSNNISQNQCYKMIASGILKII